ncbi:MAG TPA: cytochrome c oxidase subunit II [Acidimicrobiales bacterium]|nr:cytochrome c oxidase subunit II [Acidimicrobiales bacterium]
MKRSSLRRRLWTSGLLAFVLLSACGKETLPQNTLDPRGPEARRLDDLIDPVFLVAGVVFVLVQGLVLYVAFRYRRRSEDEAPKQVHGNVKAEIGWTIAPAVILLVIGVFTVFTLFDISETPAGEDVIKVTVTGHQWWWEYEYPDLEVVTANELHIPTGQKIDVTLLSDDVIHSFWPPKLAGKVDVVPNRVNKMVIEADKPGVYHGQCAEFCGLSHSRMRLQVIAHTPADFERWVASNAASAAIPDPEEDEEAAAGAAAFRAKGCASCHTVKGFAAGEVGPDLTHFAQRDTFAGAIFKNDERNLRAWLRDPPAEKPGSIMPDLDLTEDEIDDLIAYLDTLK